MKRTKNIIFISIGVMAFFIFCFEALFVIYTQQKESVQLKESLLVNMSVKEAKTFDNQISQVSQNARVLALLIENSDIIQPEMYDEFIRGTIQNETIVFGMGVWFEPYYVDLNSKYFGPYIFKDSNNKLVKTMSYSTPEYDYHNKDWYSECIISNKTIVFSPPYYDEYLDTVFMTAAVRIEKNNEAIGLVSIDITLREVNEYLMNLKQENDASVYVVTEDGFFWGRSDGQTLNFDANIRDSTNEELKNASEVMFKSYESGAITLSENIYVWSSIGDTGLRLLMAYPKWQVLSEIYGRVILNLLYFILAMIIFVVLLNVILVRVIERPLVNIIHNYIEGHEYEKSEFQSEELDLSDFDHMIQLINRLLSERERYISSLNKNNSELTSKNQEIKVLYTQSATMNETLQKLLDDIQNGYIVTVRSLSNAIEAKDKYTKGHCENVTQYALKTAKELKLSKEDLTILEYAALLHDVGKIGVESSILNKPTKLTNEEFEIIKSHPFIGYEILKDIDFLKRSALIVYEHHERFDGNGYPRGLRGNEIDVLTRIITVTDAYDAMTSARPYRSNPFSHEKAMDILKEESGSQFDPLVVEAFMKAMNK